MPLLVGTEAGVCRGRVTCGQHISKPAHQHILHRWCPKVLPDPQSHWTRWIILHPSRTHVALSSSTLGQLGQTYVDLISDRGQVVLDCSFLGKFVPQLLNLPGMEILAWEQVAIAVSIQACYLLPSVDAQRCALQVLPAFILSGLKTCKPSPQYESCSAQFTFENFGDRAQRFTCIIQAGCYCLLISSYRVHTVRHLWQLCGQDVLVAIDDAHLSCI